MFRLSWLGVLQNTICGPECVGVGVFVCADGLFDVTGIDVLCCRGIDGGVCCAWLSVITGFIIGDANRPIISVRTAATTTSAMASRRNERGAERRLPVGPEHNAPLDRSAANGPGNGSSVRGESGETNKPCSLFSACACPRCCPRIFCTIPSSSEYL